MISSLGKPDGEGEGTVDYELICVEYCLDYL